MKGVSSVIAAILLLLITVAITGFAFVFLSSMVQSPTQGAEQQIGQQIQQIATTFQIEGVSGNTVYIRNTGTQPLTNLQFLVNNVPVDYTSGPLSLAPNEVGTYALNDTQLAAIPNPSTVRVTSIGWSSDISASPTPSGDATPPLRSNGAPTGTLPIGTTSTTISLSTDETATCGYSTTPGTLYASMTSFATTGATSHSQLVSGLSDGNIYYYYVKCQDTTGNANPYDFTITFSIGSDATPPTASITSPLDGAAVYGVINVEATASDNVGVAGVQFKLNGVNLSAEDTAAPYSVSWDTTAVPNTDPYTVLPDYNLTAIARDATGNIANASISPVVFVSNVMAFIESGGQVVMEAENNDSARRGWDPPWALASSLIYGSFSGTGYANSSSDTDKAYDYPGTFSPPTIYHWYAPYLEYNVNFTTTGTYYVWIRGYGPNTAGDTVHLCMGNNTRTNVLTAQNITLSTTQFDWTNTIVGGGRATAYIYTEGVNYISICLGEDGAKVDKILLTTNSLFTPAGDGPAESQRVPSLWSGTT